MKKGIFCALLGLMLSLPVWGLARPTLTLATTEWEPYVSSHGHYPGYVYQIVKAAYEDAGFDVKIKFMNWHQALKEAKAGKIDGVFPEYYSQKHQGKWLYSQAFTGGPIGFYRRKNSNVHFEIDDPSQHIAEAVDSLNNRTFGVVKGYINFPEFDKNVSIKKKVALSDHDNLKQLYEGQVDLVVIDKFTADHLLANELPASYRATIEFMPPALAYRKLYIVMPRKNPRAEELIAAFNHGLMGIIQNGTFSKIMDEDAHMSGTQAA